MAVGGGLVDGHGQLRLVKTPVAGQFLRRFNWRRIALTNLVGAARGSPHPDFIDGTEKTLVAVVQVVPLAPPYAQLPRFWVIVTNRSVGRMGLRRDPVQIEVDLASMGVIDQRDMAPAVLWQDNIRRDRYPARRRVRQCEYSSPIAGATQVVLPLLVHDGSTVVAASRPRRIDPGFDRQRLVHHQSDKRILGGHRDMIIYAVEVKRHRRLSAAFRLANGRGSHASTRS